MLWLSFSPLHRIGWWENLNRKPMETPIFDGKNHGFRLRFSLKPIHWLEHFLYLVGCLEHDCFPYIGNFIIPTDELIFFRGVGLNHQPVFPLYHSFQIFPQFFQDFSRFSQIFPQFFPRFCPKLVVVWVFPRGLRFLCQKFPSQNTGNPYIWW